MKIIYATELFTNKQTPSIFLAGPTPRSKEVQSWRGEAITILEAIGFKGSVFIPEPKNGEFTHNYDDQIDWELEGLQRADVIVFWVPREVNTMPAFTTNVEFGMWLGSGKITLGSPPEAERMRYLINLASRKGIPHHSSLLETLNAAVNQIIERQEAPSREWFTSDTHFSSQRTLQLSRRPFSTVKEMDQVMIENWNKRISKQDTVYHLGDFGDYEIAKQLNGNIILVLGNYERDDIGNKKVSLEELKSIFFAVHEFPLLLSTPLECLLVHEPSDRDYKSYFCLYGHIHERQKVKQNSLNVGVDCHHFSPVDLETVLFYKEAIQKHYDSEVFME